jgi:hypothetical protein
LKFDCAAYDDKTAFQLGAGFAPNAAPRFHIIVADDRHCALGAGAKLVG